MATETPADTPPAAYPRRTLEAFLARAAEQEDHLRQAITTAQNRAHAATAPRPNGATAHVGSLLEDLSVEFATRRREVEGEIEDMLATASDTAAHILKRARADARKLLDHPNTGEPLGDPTGETHPPTDAFGTDAVPDGEQDPTSDPPADSTINESDEATGPSPLHGLRLAFVAQSAADQTDDPSVAWRWTP